MVGPLARALRAIPIRQDSADRSALHRLEGLLRQGEAVVVFPEGHESVTGELQPLQGGVLLLAARTGAPVLPLGIRGTEGMLPPRSFRFQRASRPARVRFGRLLSLDELSGGRSGRAAISHGLALLADAIRELSMQPVGHDAPSGVVQSVAEDDGKAGASVAEHADT